FNRLTTDDIGGSQGVTQNNFISVISQSAVDNCVSVPDAVFHDGVGNTRRVTGRNAPSNINAAFNFRNFWDGRARETFNGQNPGTPVDATARIYRTDATGHAAPVQVSILNSSAASQATGPMLSGTEMSCAGRTRPDVGRKLLSLIPLGHQLVSPTDSVLAGL